MGFRESLNRNPAITTGATAGIIVVALGFIFWTTFGGGTGGGFDPNGKAFFTADDGATFVVDSGNKRYAPPVIAGKPSLYAHVFTCEGGPKFVGYLERITADAAKALEAAKNAPAGQQGIRVSPEAIVSSGREVKRPKGAEWVNANTPEGMAVIDVKCPDGNSFATEVSPDE